MRVFVTGASGWIGSAVTRELLSHGHSVLGVARSEQSEQIVRALGADVCRGRIDDPIALAQAAAQTDAVVHLAYNHDFSQMEQAAATDAAVIAAMGDALAGSDKPFLIANGTLGLAAGRLGTEQDRPDGGAHPRIANAAATLALAERGVRALVSRFAPTVHGQGDLGFVAVLARIAREKGVAGYIEDGSNRWPAVHQLDAATLVRLAIEQAPAGTIVHAVAEEGITARSIAEALGRQLGVPVASVPADQAAEHFGWIGMFFGADVPASNALTREQLGWNPTHATLIEDIDAGYYDGTASH